MGEYSSPYKESGLNARADHKEPTKKIAPVHASVKEIAKSKFGKYKSTRHYCNKKCESYPCSNKQWFACMRRGE